MRMEKMYMPTLKENPQDAEIASHKLLLRAGMIRKSASGIYSYLPLGLRVIKKIEQIVRNSMDKFGAQEVLMSALQPQEIWEESGRWDKFGEEMFRLKDRNGRDYCLGPTAEEYFTTLIRDEIKSYKQLPLNIYQIQTKYRDEKRPRFGINRAREFTMKDAYSFDKNVEGLKKSYQNMWDAYVDVFDTIGLDYRIVEGDSGLMGTGRSHEFIAMAETGEGVIVYSNDSDYAATDEKYKVSLPILEKEEPKEKEKVHTPGVKTIEDLSKFLSIDKTKLLKSIAFTTKEESYLVLIPGDRELNINKFLAFAQISENEIEMASDEDIINKFGSQPGFIGPIGLNKDVNVIIDSRVKNMSNFVIGSNEADYHILNVNYGKDFEAEIAEDILMIQEGDKGPNGEDLIFARGIEVGNIFELGQKYSKPLNAKFLDENGKEQYFEMGSYGIGITRTVTAVIEQNYDEDGIIWPESVAPYKAIITIVKSGDENQVKLAEEIYQELISAGVEVLLDDRNERPGVKFKDRDLIGIPHRITVGRDASEGFVEYSTRKEKENIKLSVQEAIEKIK
ncbi:proline--tRNA ligase [Helcococcus kunzii]|uniref:proline--tRNA ligase n=1 Tax=Helcococcus kunzii TaxID=40091 RepID=UPI0021A7602F|nr:proline--tRNA ligase [Helcococcus kunzii]MCT1796284.1 proline--tRNA ligase [Helcococcus kunzii]MCT1989142.1 proline--tRNA ligase [Helcococcus kunzii]